MIHALFILACLATADEHVVIVPGPRWQKADEYKSLFTKNRISPKEACELVNRHMLKRDPTDDDFGFDERNLEGMLNDEYVFNYLGSDHKRGFFVATGYRVNVNTGAVRHVDWKEASKEFGGMFPKGLIRPAKYVAKKPEKLLPHEILPP